MIGVKLDKAKTFYKSIRCYLRKPHNVSHLLFNTFTLRNAKWLWEVTKLFTQSYITKGAVHVVVVCGLDKEVIP